MNEVESTSRPAAARTVTRRTRLFAVLAAVLASSLIWLVATLLDIDLLVDPGNGQPVSAIGLGSVIFVTLLMSLLGWGTLALLERITRRGTTIWGIIAVLVLAFSFVPVLWVGAADSVKFLLTLMHLAVGVALIPAFLRTGASRNAKNS